MPDNPGNENNIPTGNNQPEQASGEEIIPSPVRDNIWPFKNEDQARQAAELFCRFHTKANERLKILAKLKKSKAVAMPAMEIIFNSFIRLDIETRHQILDVLVSLKREGVDISALAEPLSANLNDANFALREKVCSLLVSMGEGAKAAMERALGCTRNTIREIRQSGIKVLGAIGPLCGFSVVRRLESLRKQIPENDKEAVQDLDLAIKSISTTVTQGQEKQDETHCMRPSESFRVAIDAEQVKDSRRCMLEVMEGVKSLSTPGISPEVVQRIVANMKGAQPTLRMAGLVKCLEVQDTSMRVTAARFILAYSADAATCIHAIVGAYKREQVQAVRDVLRSILGKLSDKLKTTPPPLASETVIMPNSASGGKL